MMFMVTRHQNGWHTLRVRSDKLSALEQQQALFEFEVLEVVDVMDDGLKMLDVLVASQWPDVEVPEYFLLYNPEEEDIEHYFP